MVITPIVSTVTTPMVSVTMPNSTIQSVTYNQFLNSLGKYDYGVEFFYMWAQSLQQIGQPVFYNHTAVNGDQVSVYLPFTVDPYQKQPSTYYETEPDEIIFDGLSSLTIPIFGNSTVYLKAYVLIAYISGYLDAKKENNFDEVEKLQGFKFFDDYCNYITD